MFQVLQLERHSHPMQSLMGQASINKLRLAFQVLERRVPNRLLCLVGTLMIKTLVMKLSIPGRAAETHPENMSKTRAELERGNLALAKDELEGLPVRIIRRRSPG